MSNYELRIANYEEAISFLFKSLPVWERAGAGAYKPGLERISAFTALLGNPRQHFRSVHVAGTNGKGSVCHLLAAVLQSAGYRTGLFTSPHLVDFRERIRVDGEMIPEQAVTEFTERWRDEMVHSGLTFFEMTTAMAFWWFERAKCDVAIIETGLGGRLDSTNIITPLVSVITNIGLEHTQYLGETIAAIAAEKAGIIKPGVPVVIGESDPDSERVFRARAAETGSEIVFANTIRYFFDGQKSNQKTHPMHRKSVPIEPKTIHFAARQNEFVLDSSPRRFSINGDFKLFPTIPSEADKYNYDLDLAGDYQQKNLATVLTTIEILRRTFQIPDDALREGLAHTAAMTGLRGRWQVVRQQPLIVLDTAHNAHGIAIAARQTAKQKYDKLYMVLGFASDKDLGSIIPLLPRRAHYIFTSADNPRAMQAEALAERFGRFWDDHPVGSMSCHHSKRGELPSNTCTSPSVAAAVEKAIELAGPHDMIFIGGSNFVVGEALTALDC